MKLLRLYPLQFLVFVTELVGLLSVILTAQILLDQQQRENVSYVNEFYGWRYRHSEARCSGLWESINIGKTFGMCAVFADPSALRQDFEYALGIMYDLTNSSAIQELGLAEGTTNCTQDLQGNPYFSETNWFIFGGTSDSVYCVTELSRSVRLETLQRNLNDPTLVQLVARVPDMGGEVRLGLEEVGGLQIKDHPCLGNFLALSYGSVYCTKTVTEKADPFTLQSQLSVVLIAVSYIYLGSYALKVFCRLLLRSDPRVVNFDVLERKQPSTVDTSSLA